MVGIRVDGVVPLPRAGRRRGADRGGAGESARSHADGRERFRMLLARALYEQYGRKLDDLAFRSFEELQGALRGLPRQRRRRGVAAPRSRSSCCAACSPPRGWAARGWSDADLPLLDEARALLDGPARAARPRDRRRGAGPDADAAAHARAAHDGRDDDPRRHRAGRRADRATTAGRTCCRTSPTDATFGRGAPPRVPRPAPGDGARAPAAAADRARRCARRSPTATATSRRASSRSPPRARRLRRSARPPPRRGGRDVPR